MPGTYRKKPLEISAVQWRGDNLAELEAFAGKAVRMSPSGNGILEISTMANGWVPSPIGEWLLRGVKGEFYPCADAVFRASYEPARLGTPPLQVGAWLLAKLAPAAVGGQMQVTEVGIFSEPSPSQVGFETMWVQLSSQEAPTYGEARQMLLDRVEREPWLAWVRGFLKTPEAM